MLDVRCSSVPQPWLLLQSGPGDPALNMALDEALLEGMSRLGRPGLRFYGWTEPAATFGYFQKYAEVERATHLRPLIRRPTGGGIVPHDADWTYSLVFPPGHEWHALKAEESYRRVHEWIQTAFAKLKVATELAPSCKKSFPSSRSSRREEAHSEKSEIGNRKSEITPHAILFDPYSPKKNPTMWTVPLFTGLFRRLDPQRSCALATYTRSTMARVTMLLGGFFVGVGHPSGLKEETTVAANRSDLLDEPLDRCWLERAKRSHSAEPLGGPVYRQSPLSPETRERLRLHPQFR